MPTLSAVAGTVPGPPVPQSTVESFAAQHARSSGAAHLLARRQVYANTGIETRHFVRPFEWYFETRGWAGRMAAFEADGLDLLEQTFLRVLEEASTAEGRTITPDEIDGIVFVTTTGIATPSLDALLADRVGLRADVQRVPLWGLGCAGGVAGLRLTADLADRTPGSRWVLLSLELCSLAFRPEDTSVRAFVANALFSDGCAGAMVVGTSPAEGRADVSGEGAPVQPTQTTVHVGAGRSHRWPDSRDVMGWRVEDEGLNVVFSKEIPMLLGRDVDGIVRDFMGTTEGFRPVFHPGGRKVLEAFEQGLRLEHDALAPARDVLRRYGNMSSPTVLFVLEAMLRGGERPTTETPWLMAAVGPGFSAELLRLETRST